MWGSARVSSHYTNVNGMCILLFPRLMFTFVTQLILVSDLSFSLSEERFVLNIVHKAYIYIYTEYFVCGRTPNTSLFYRHLRLK